MRMAKSMLIRALVAIVICIILIALYIIAENSTSKVKMVQTFEYPEARRDDTIVEEHFGTKVSTLYLRRLGKVTHQFTDSDWAIGRRSVSLAGGS